MILTLPEHQSKIALINGMIQIGPSVREGSKIREENKRRKKECVIQKNILNRMMCLSLLASLGFVALLSLAQTDAALAAEPPLGLVQQFGVLGSAGVTAAGSATVVNGDVGSATTVTGAWSTVPPFTVHAPADAIVGQALIDATAASTNLLGQGPGALLGAGLGGTTLGPGVYSFAVTADIAASTTFTLSGAGSYVFLVPSSLTANVLSSVVLDGVDPCQVFWRVGSTATLNGLNFPGTVIAGAEGAGSVIVGSGDLTGRAVSLTAAVTMAGPANNILGCSTNAPLVIGAVAPTVSKSFSPTTITAGGTSTLTFTLSNSSIDTADTIITLTDYLPSGMVIANEPNIVNGCGSAVTTPGGNTVVLTGGSIPAADITLATAGTCTVSVDVTSTVGGPYINTLQAGDLFTDNGRNAAPASATLTAATAAAAVPTLNEWGVIIFMVLAGLGSVYYLRKYRRV